MPGGGGGGQSYANPTYVTGAADTVNGGQFSPGVSLSYLTFDDSVPTTTIGAGQPTSWRYNAGASATYAAEPAIGDRSNRAPSCGPATSYTIIGLASPATTMVQVAAVTAAGQGARSVAVRPPAAVTTLTARGLKGGCVSLAWQPPATNGGSPLVGYVIAVSKNGKPWTTLTTVDAGQTSLLLTGLKRSVRYRFRIQPLTEAWAGPWSAISNPVSPR